MGWGLVNISGAVSFSLADGLMLKDAPVPHSPQWHRGILMKKSPSLYMHRNEACYCAFWSYLTGTSLQAVDLPLGFSRVNLAPGLTPALSAKSLTVSRPLEVTA